MTNPLPTAAQRAGANLRPGIDTFIEVDYPEPHRDRARAILRAHPEVRQLFGRTPATAALIVAVVAFQLVIAWALRAQPWWLVVAVAWFVGAFANHALFVFIHEVSHNLIHRKKWANQLWGIVANLPLVVPSSASFSIYHLKHHQYQGDYDLDADVAGRWEARLVGRSTLGKVLWELLFPIFQSVRVARFSRKSTIPFATRWVVLNIVVQFAFDALVWWLWGPWALLYLALSLWFSVGFHPLGARWIQEHFVVVPGQETYSYYGPLNTVAFNVGYHNEHHDFPFVAWNRLPALKALAPEFYDSLYSHRSWVRLWLRFLFDRNLTLYSRIVRDGRINARRGRRPKETAAPDTLDEAAGDDATAAEPADDASHVRVQAAGA